MTDFLLKTFLVTLVGLGIVWGANATTILPTATTDLIGTFRTNVNTSLGNLNTNKIEAIGSDLGLLMSTGTATSVIAFASTTAGRVLTASDTVPWAYWTTSGAGVSTSSFAQSTGISITHTANTTTWTNTGVTSFATTSPLTAVNSTGTVTLSCPTCLTNSGGASAYVSTLTASQPLNITSATGTPTISVSGLAASSSMGFMFWQTTSNAALNQYAQLVPGASLTISSSGASTTLNTIQAITTASTPTFAGLSITGIFDAFSGILSSTNTINFASSSLFRVTTGAAPTVSTSGALAIDTTANQLLYTDGIKLGVLVASSSKSITFQSATTTAPFAEARFNLANDITVYEVDCQTEPQHHTASFVIESYSGTVTTTMLGATACNTTAATTTSFSVATALAGQWVTVRVVAASGTPALFVTEKHTYTRK